MKETNNPIKRLKNPKETLPLGAPGSFFRSLNLSWILLSPGSLLTLLDTACSRQNVCHCSMTVVDHHGSTTRTKDRHSSSNDFFDVLQHDAFGRPLPNFLPPKSAYCHRSSWQSSPLWLSLDVTAPTNMALSAVKAQGSVVVIDGGLHDHLEAIFRLVAVTFGD